MREAAPRPGWAVSLDGEADDLIDLQQNLLAPFEPWLEKLGDASDVVTVLRSSAWQNLDTPSDVHADADRILERIHGIALLQDRHAMRIRPNHVYKIHADGRRDTYIIPQSGKLIYTGGRPRIIVSRIDNSDVEFSESEAQKQYRLAESDDLRSELFTHISRGSDWYNLYKVLELVKRIAGGEKCLRSSLGHLWDTWNSIRQTANCHRHAPDLEKYPLPSPPVELAVAWPFALSAAKQILSKVRTIPAP